MKRLRRGCHWCGLSVKHSILGARIGRPGRVGPGRKCSADPTTEPLRGKKHIHRTQDDTNMLDQGLIPPTGDLGGDEKTTATFQSQTDCCSRFLVKERLTGPRAASAASTSTHWASSSGDDGEAAPGSMPPRHRHLLDPPWRRLLDPPWQRLLDPPWQRLQEPHRPAAENMTNNI